MATAPPVPLDVVLILINRFTKSNAEFLNDFSKECERRLDVISRRIERLTLEVNTLESKHGALNQEEEEEEEQESPIPPVQPAQTPMLPSSRHQEQVPNEESVQPNPSQAPAPPAPETTVGNADPKVNLYKSMIKVGIAKDAVALKMKSNGDQKYMYILGV